MKLIYVLRESRRLRRILNDTYPAIIAALKIRRPKAKILTEDAELSQAHDCLALIRLGYLKVDELTDQKGQLVTVEINEVSHNKRKGTKPIYK